MLSIDPVKRVLKFPHVCLDALSFCHAICCRQWHVGLLPSEFQSGKYKAESFCSCDQKTCAGKVKKCFQRQFRLKQKEDKSCIYLGDDSTCTIYNDRPKVCREFSCKSGWQLSSVAPLPKTDRHAADESNSPYTGELHDSIVFMHNPLIRLKTVFYSAESKEMVFITKPASKCMAMPMKAEVDVGALSDDQILECFSLFDGTTEMEKIQAFAIKLGVSNKSLSQLVFKLIEFNLLVPLISLRS